MQKLRLNAFELSVKLSSCRHSLFLFIPKCSSWLMLKDDHCNFEAVDKAWKICCNTSFFKKKNNKIKIHLACSFLLATTENLCNFHALNTGARDMLG